MVGAVPQTLRGMPGGFGGQQQQQQPQPQPQQPGRAGSSRLPNGKLGMIWDVRVDWAVSCSIAGADWCAMNTANNSSGWAFGGGVPMGAAGLPNPNRQLGGNVSFAQSLSGSQPATPLDLSYVLPHHPHRCCLPFFRIHPPHQFMTGM